MIDKEIEANTRLDLQKLAYPSAFRIKSADDLIEYGNTYSGFVTSNSLIQATGEQLKISSNSYTSLNLRDDTEENTVESLLSYSFDYVII